MHMKAELGRTFIDVHDVMSKWTLSKGNHEKYVRTLLQVIAGDELCTFDQMLRNTAILTQNRPILATKSVISIKQWSLVWFWIEGDFSFYRKNYIVCKVLSKLIKQNFLYDKRYCDKSIIKLAIHCAICISRQPCSQSPAQYS